MWNNPIRYDDPDGNCPMCIIPILYAAFELASSAADVHDVVTTVSDPDASTADKVISVVGAGAGLILPGGGYSKVDDVVKGTKKAVTATKAKNLEKAAEKGIPKSQLGPSGKPKIHKVSKANNKKAKDAARNNSKSNTKPVKHSSDKGQKTHYHATKDGKKLGGKDNVHYEDRSTKKNPK